MDPTAVRPSTEQVWGWLAEVPDPEIPVVSVVDLGIVRDVRWDGGRLLVTITPTYTGCPASEVIAREIETALRRRGVAAVTLTTRLSPPWTTDWLTESGRQKLTAYGIAPPAGKSSAPSALLRRSRDAVPVECPRCGSMQTERVSEFGSTPCKALYRCRDCLEPFDHLKCI